VARREVSWLMKVRVRFFAAFKEIFGAGEREIELDSGASVQDLLNILCDSSGCRQKIFDETGRLRRDIKMLKKGRHIQLVDETHSELEDGDVITVFPALFGG
jgi:molybdopterin synthase sulfur carrier subunit